MIAVKFDERAIYHHRLATGKTAPFVEFCVNDDGRISQVRNVKGVVAIDDNTQISKPMMLKMVATTFRVVDSVLISEQRTSGMGTVDIDGNVNMFFYLPTTVIWLR